MPFPIKAHRNGTIKRMAGEPVILAVQDTTGVNYNGRPPGVKTVWRGLQEFYTLYGYREMFDFMGQV
jgi:hypothetical protein